MTTSGVGPAASDQPRLASTPIGRALMAINLATVAGAIVLLALSLWPGFAGWWMALALPLVGLLGLAWLRVVGRRLPPPWGRSVPIPARQVLPAPILVCLTLGLLTLYIPRRVGFWIVQEQFNRQLASAPISDYRGAVLDRQLGIYRVDRYASDPRGGVFFRTGTGADGLGPDVMSYGFVYRPNRQGTPFGAAHYRVGRLFGDWYWFAVSDDW